MPKGKTQFLDGNGAPLAGGSVSFYIPGTTTQLATYQDQALSVENTNPVILDANGEALIWGFGSFRQVVQDVNGNTIWDEVVSTPSVTVLATDGGVANALSVTVNGLASLFAGLVLVAIPAASNTGASTITVNGLAAANITIGSTNLVAGALAAGVAAQMIYDGTNFQLINPQAPPTSNAPGDIKAIAGNTAPTGWDFCIGKTYSRVTNSALFAAIGTLWGAGDGSTTFLGPDFRGRTLFADDAMGGTAANRLTSASLGTGVSATVGVTGGNENTQAHGHGATSSATDPGHVHADTQDNNITTGTSASGPLSTTGAPGTTQSGNIQRAYTGITVATTIDSYGSGNSQNLPPAAIINWIMYVGG
ncbi:MAG: tail fiber protein [Rhodospirillales bacterium]|nr:tail fiber protein [Rhodospirillales bacterium]